VRGSLVAFLLLASYGFLFPWAAGEHALARYPGQTPILVSYFFSFQPSWNASSHALELEEKDETKSYILFPSVFTNPRVVTVSQTNDDEPTVSESRGPFIMIALTGLIALLFWASGTLQFLCRRRIT
jgi:hypothetical protein